MLSEVRRGMPGAVEARRSAIRSAASFDYGPVYPTGPSLRMLSSPLRKSCD